MENKDVECSSQAIRGAVDSNRNKQDNALRITSIPLHLKWNETEILIEHQSATSVTSEGSWHKCNFNNLVKKMLQTEQFIISIYHQQPKVHFDVVLNNKSKSSPTLSMTNDETSCKTDEESEHFKSDSIISSSPLEYNKLRPSRKCKDDMQGIKSSPRRSNIFQHLRYKHFQHHITTLAQMLDIFCKALHVDYNAKSNITTAFVHPKTRLHQLEQIITDGSINRHHQMKHNESPKKHSLNQFYHTDVAHVHDIVMRASILIRLWQYTLCKGDSVSTSRPNDPGWGELHNGKILEISLDSSNREDMINRFILENVIGCYKFKSFNELGQYHSTFIRLSLVGYSKDAEIFVEG